MKKSLLSWMPQRFRDWREARQLEKHIEAVNADFQTRRAATKSEEEQYHIDQEWDYRIEEDANRLSLLKTKYLIGPAEGLGIEIPSDAWSTDLGEHVQFLGPPARAKLQRQISEARFTYWERWARLVIPTLSLIVALIALLRRPPC